MFKIIFKYLSFKEKVFFLNYKEWKRGILYEKITSRIKEILYCFSKQDRKRFLCLSAFRYFRKDLLKHFYFQSKFLFQFLLLLLFLILNQVLKIFIVVRKKYSFMN